MGNSLKKRGQKLARRFSRASAKASEESRERIQENFIGRLSHIKNVKLLIFEWGLLVLALIMLAVTQAFWFSGSYAEDAFISGGSYTEATLGRVNSMNPLFATTSSEKTLSRLMFATLTTVDYSGNPGLQLAESLRPSEDGKVWTMKLRDGLVWSDGEPLTSDDVMFTINLIQNPASNTIYDSNLAGVKVEEKENGEIVFTLSAAYADFMTALEIPIVPKHELNDANVKTLVEDDFSNAPVTSGAFKFNALQTAATDGEKVIYLSANPYYYLGRPMLNTFAVHTFLTKEEIVAALNAGTVTATAELAGLEVELVTSTGFIQRETPVNAGVFIFFNTKSNSLKDLELRKTIREGLSLAALRAQAPGHNAINYPLLPEQMALDNYPALPAENFLEATEKIEKLMGDGDTIALNIATVNSGYLPAVSEELKNQLVALGIEDVSLMVYEETQDFITNILAKRNYDILVYEIELGADPDPLPYYHSSQAMAAGLNLSNYSNTLVDDLLVGARETLDEKLRAKKYESFLNYWVADVPAIGLYQADMYYIYNRNAQVYSENTHLATALDRFSDISNYATARGTRNLTP